MSSGCCSQWRRSSTPWRCCSSSGRCPRSRARSARRSTAPVARRRVCSLVISISLAPRSGCDSRCGTEAVSIPLPERPRRQRRDRPTPLRHTRSSWDLFKDCGSSNSRASARGRCAACCWPTWAPTWCASTASSPAAWAWRWTARHDVNARGRRSVALDLKSAGRPRRRAAAGRRRRRADRRLPPRRGRAARPRARPTARRATRGWSTAA